MNWFFNLSTLNSNFALTPGYLNPALDNSAQVYMYILLIVLDWGELGVSVYLF